MNIYQRHPSSKSEKKLSERLGLYWDNEMQDWDLVVSNPNRIKDFLKVYQNELKDEDDKFTLMGLIVASFDDVAHNFDSEINQYWKTCEKILEKECFLHYSIIKYWSLLGKDVNNTFPISLLMRSIWEKVKINFQ